MDTGPAIVIAAAALVVVFVVTKKQEQQTAVQAAAIVHHTQSAVLDGSGTVAGVAAGVATYFGGPAAGGAVLRVSGQHL